MLLVVLTVLEWGGPQHEGEVEQRRATALELVAQSRQSANDLSEMARLYVSTRDPLYRTYFNQILAIRSGKAQRPVGYDSSFWTRVLAGESQSVSYGQPESLVTQAHSA